MLWLHGRLLCFGSQQNDTDVCSMLQKKKKKKNVLMLIHWLTPRTGFPFVNVQFQFNILWFCFDKKNDTKSETNKQPNDQEMQRHIRLSLVLIRIPEGIFASKPFLFCSFSLFFLSDFPPYARDSRWVLISSFLTLFNSLLCLLLAMWQSFLIFFIAAVTWELQTLKMILFACGAAAVNLQLQRQ